jgi:Cu/Ag efflux pump CusA
MERPKLRIKNQDLDRYGIDANADISNKIEELANGLEDGIAGQSHRSDVSVYNARMGKVISNSQEKRKQLLIEHHNNNMRELGKMVKLAQDNSMNQIRAIDAESDQIVIPKVLSFADAFDEQMGDYSLGGSSSVKNDKSTKTVDTEVINDGYDDELSKF